MSTTPLIYLRGKNRIKQEQAVSRLPTIQYWETVHQLQALEQEIKDAI